MVQIRASLSHLPGEELVITVTDYMYGVSNSVRVSMQESHKSPVLCAIKSRKNGASETVWKNAPEILRLLLGDSKAFWRPDCKTCPTRFQAYIEFLALPNADGAKSNKAYLLNTPERVSVSCEFCMKGC
jgi:hypothetical protein